MSKVSSTRKLVSASALMASGTLISRVLGLVRVMLIAFILGNTTRQADILALATMVPNSLYILFAGGALNTVLVPQIVRAIKNDDDGGEAYTNRIMTAFMLIVAAVAVVVTLAAPVVTALYTSEGWRAPELAAQYASMVALTYLTLPQIFFYGAFFLLGQVLNARDKFGPMMWAPIANNVISILVLGIYLVVWGSGGDRDGAFTTAQILVLGIGSTVGIAAQSLVLLPYLKKVGFRFRPRFDLKGTGLGKTFSLTKWTIGFVAVNQLALLVVTRLATSATAAGGGGGLDVYNKAHLLWILPHSLITVSLATAMLPNASRLASAGNLRGVAQEATQTMRLALIVLIPAAVGFFTLAEPIASLFFAHGQGSGDADPVAWALMGFAIGLVPFTVQFICLRTYYALEDTRTPFLLQCAIAGANALLAVLLVWWIEDAGLVATALAVAYSVAYLIGVFISWHFLSRKVPALSGRLVVMHVVRLTLGAAIGGVAAWFGARLVVDLLGGGILGNVLAIVGGLLVIGVCHVGIAKALRVREFRDLSALLGTVLRRKGRKAAAPADPLTDDADDDRPAGRSSRTATRPRPTSAVDARDEYSAGAIAGGLTEDLMPTQLTPAVRDDLEPGLVDAGTPRFDRDDDASAVEDDGDEDTFRRPAEEPVDDEALIETQMRPGAAIPAVGPVPASSFVPAVPADVVTPAPAPADDDAATDDDEDTAPTHLAPLGEPGMLINTRYRLEEELSDRGWIASWRAHDLVLSRDVVTHLLRSGDHRVHDVIDSARTAAVATDSRFLRVLDAVIEDDATSGVGAYVICEHTAGRSLTQVLGFGPLSALESAWVVRELADALVGMHSQGLFHEHLTPDNVMITSNGDVKLVGFGVESAIASDDRAELWSEREAADVKGLAKILYATLVQRWPGGPAHGLEAAPIIAGEPASPHIVRSGVSPALDRITTATLTERGAAAERRITTASQLAGALSEVLGTANASSDLEERVRLTTGPAPKRATPETVAYATPATPASPPATPVPSPVATPSPPIDEHDELHASLHDAPTSPSSPLTVLEEEERQPGRPVLWLIVALVLGAFVVSLVMVAVNNARDTAGTDTGDGQTTSGPETPGETPGGEATGALEIVAGADFDPTADGGNDEENPDQVPLAFDGDPATGWSTLRYHNRPTLGGLKPGVGLVLDLGEERTVNEVELTFAAPGSTVEIRVPAEEGATEAPMGSQADWAVVATQAEVPASVTLAPEAPTTTRFVLVYLTSLPEVSEARYLAQLNEVVIR